jgi:hypothetical protein
MNVLCEINRIASALPHTGQILFGSSVIFWSVSHVCLQARHKYS